MPGLTSSWQTASSLFFLYVSLVGLLGRRPRAGRRRAVGLATVGLAASMLSAVVPPWAWLHDWVLPPVLLLLAYWSSGALFVAPMPRAEAVLMAVDRALGIPSVKAPRAAAEFLESAYVGVYPIVGLAFVLYLWLTPAADAGRFWTVVLVTDYICFGVLPWVQTRPPRALENRDGRPSGVRGFNLRLLGATSIQVNTFPSGHAAEALAAALLLAGAPTPIVLGMFFGALAISAGAVLGRYHYALDAVAGWLVAVVVWLA
jgi:membrane-associated phospholipid phosphatase